MDHYLKHDNEFLIKEECPDYIDNYYDCETQYHNENEQESPAIPSFVIPHLMKVRRANSLRRSLLLSNQAPSQGVCASVVIKKEDPSIIIKEEVDLDDNCPASESLAFPAEEMQNVKDGQTYHMKPHVSHENLSNIKPNSQPDSKTNTCHFVRTRFIKSPVGGIPSEITTNLSAHVGYMKPTSQVPNQTVAEEKLMICKVCDAKFKYPAHLYEHWKVHAFDGQRQAGGSANVNDAIHGQGQAGDSANINDAIHDGGSLFNSTYANESVDGQRQACDNAKKSQVSDGNISAWNFSGLSRDQRAWISNLFNLGLPKKKPRIIWVKRSMPIKELPKSSRAKSPSSTLHAPVHQSIGVDLCREVVTNNKAAISLKNAIAVVTARSPGFKRKKPCAEHIRLKENANGSPSGSVLPIVTEARVECKRVAEEVASPMESMNSETHQCDAGTELIAKCHSYSKNSDIVSLVPSSRKRLLDCINKRKKRDASSLNGIRPCYVRLERLSPVLIGALST